MRNFLWAGLLVVWCSWVGFWYGSYHDYLALLFFWDIMLAVSIYFYHTITKYKEAQK